MQAPWAALAAMVLMVPLLQAAPVSGGGAIVGHTDAEGALAIWSGVDETGCVRGLTVVGAVDYRLSGPPGAPESGSYVGATIIRSDFCEGRLLVFAHGSAFLDDDVFAVAGDIESARLDASIPMRDSMSGDVFDLHASIEFVGGDEVMRITSTEMTFFSPGELSRERSDARIRPGAATGSALGSDGWDYSAVPPVYAEIYEGGAKRVGTLGAQSPMVDRWIAATLEGESISVSSGAEQGRNADATWTSMDGTECFLRTVRLRGSETMRDPAQGPRTEWYGMAHVSVIDVCEGRFVSYATRNDRMDRGAFTMHGTVERAALAHTFTAHDWVRDQEVEIDVDVTWARDGDILRDLEFYDVHLVREDDVFVMHNKQFASDAWATAQGSVRLDGIEQLHAPTDYASLWTARSIRV